MSEGSAVCATPTRFAPRPLCPSVGMTQDIVLQRAGSARFASIRRSGEFADGRLRCKVIAVVAGAKFAYAGTQLTRLSA